MELILQPHLGKKQSQQSYPAVSIPILRGQQLPHLKTEHKNKPHLPKDITRNPEIQTEPTGEELSPTKQTCKVWKKSPLTQIYR